MYLLPISSSFTTILMASGILSFVPRLQELLVIVFLFAFSISIHESAHAYMAYRLGDTTAKDRGRISLNPLVHFDFIGFLFLLLFKIGWAKPVPVDASRFHKHISVRQGMLLTALAGPVSNLILAFLAYFLFVLSFTLNLFTVQASLILPAMLTLNVYLAVFNLLPLPPLDGFKIFGTLLPRSWYMKLLYNERYIGMLMLVFWLALGGLWRYLLELLSTPVIRAILFIVNSFFSLF